VFAFFAMTAITIFGSDDSILHKNCHIKWHQLRNTTHLLNSVKKSNE